ncbi:MarR family transcriptional regulator [Streptomyces sp. HNM0575]|uniref:MarR family winged helix-turn-helix transcriptional regulator n=1 Tax=Streptomyces sp. HNM0575 TaxID=2716338 RepID=UPI00145E1007|nr:MarR family transcriptional regulator [Streptomyces sp. HNM0575]NLU72969.1 MarR family transcriptional regulator [Streptomyces sp. HNM0575]
MHDANRTANLLGATALAVSDLALTGATRAAGVSASGAAALVVLSASPGLSVTELGRRVGLSQPAAARMVDSLQSGGLVERRQGPGRWVSVKATAAGRRTARTMLAARGTPLSGIVEALDEGERETLDALLEKLLTRLYGEVGDADLVCRLCDREGCVRGGAVCPVGQAERDERSEGGDDGRPEPGGG